MNRIYKRSYVRKLYLCLDYYDIINRKEIQISIKIFGNRKLKIEGDIDK